MAIYENRDIRESLLFKLEEFEPSSKFSDCMGWDGKSIHSDTYYKLYDIITNYRNDLQYIHDLLSQVMKRCSGAHEYYRKLCNLRLSILECRLRRACVETYQQDYLGMKDLPKFGCKHKDIENLTGYRNGTPDFRAVSPFGNEWEIKVIIGNRIVFTRAQLDNFDQNVNILVYRKAEYSSHIDRVRHVGCKFHNHIKFGDICNVLLGKKSYFEHKIGNKLLDYARIVYHISVEDSQYGATSIMVHRYQQ
jgi:hypothetical protein